MISISTNHDFSATSLISFINPYESLSFKNPRMNPKDELGYNHSKFVLKFLHHQDYELNQDNYGIR